MKTINVVAAVIRDEDKVLATARGYGEYKGWWEFPGGKIESGETPKEALVREIQEELDIRIEINEYITTVEYDYPQFHLSMQCYFCNRLSGNLTLKEAESSRWLSKEKLNSVKWLPADMILLDYIRVFLEKRC
ncbi:(deoxy)nucleoside triphosphate pyrophosphohydrolase [Solobacterium moorei]|uniref:(deoxy)nucleoside triphosphate pyrophosphohydrolase n=1 Tax=Solobacterium moorei TaxID=102148 RepID=UPI000403D142|nr:(deoxy)nucleoside triphosphate pyrophosphohydrolase [Solobacterium moorei]BET20776.1 8-oxo-dGTP diphosphatase MutT [Solobacterium moorei]